VALFNQILEAQPLAGVAPGNVYHQPQVGPDHAIAGIAVARANAVGQLLLLLSAEERCLVDLAEVGFQRRLHHVATGPAESCHEKVSSALGLSEKGTGPLRRRANPWITEGMQGSCPLFGQLRAEFLFWADIVV